MAHRYSDVNNCPNCRNKLWFRKHQNRYFYNCLSCGYEHELEQPVERNRALLTEFDASQLQLDFDDPNAQLELFN